MKSKKLASITITAILVISIIALMTIPVSAQISGSVTTTGEDVFIKGNTTEKFNFTITDTRDASYYITYINITNQTGFTFNTDTNGSTIASDFSVVGVNLTWKITVTTFSGTTEYFWFNATAPTLAANTTYTWDTYATYNDSQVHVNKTFNVTVIENTPPVVTIDTPTESAPVYRKGGEQFYVNFTYTELNPKNYTVDVGNSTDVINTTTVNYPAGGTDQVANISFNLNSTAADGKYNVTVKMYDNASNYGVSYQNYSVVKDDTSPSVVIDEPTESAPVYRKGEGQFYVNFTYTELNPKNYTVEIRNSTTVINSTTNPSVVGGTNLFANESFNLNSTAADGKYNVTVKMYDNVSFSYTAYQNYSVVKDDTSPSAVIDTPTESTPVYRKGGEQFYVNFTYTELNPKNYTVEIRNSTTVINSTTNSSVVGGTNLFANESFNLNSTAADGKYNVTVKIYDNVSLSYTAYQNYSVIKDNTPPVITTPPDQTVEQGSTKYITWNVTDTNPNKYWVLRNGAQVVAPTDYTSGADFDVQINTSTLGDWNYTIVANDTAGNEAIDEVIITVRPVPPAPVPEFNAIGLLAFIGILSIVLAIATLRRKR